MRIKEVLIATHNPGKFVEFKEELKDAFDTIYSLSDFGLSVDFEEGEVSYAQNAMVKSRKAGDLLGIPTIADDSGLEVEFLGGRPGLLSKRYGMNDSERIDRLLKELSGVPWEKRRAKFKAYLSFYIPDKEQYQIFYGELEGIIGFERREGYGFGYDPIFFVPSLNLYLSELEPAEKNKLSHRGKALRILKSYLWSQRDSNSRFWRERPVS